MYEKNKNIQPALFSGEINKQREMNNIRVNISTNANLIFLYQTFRYVMIS